MFVWVSLTAWVEWGAKPGDERLNHENSKIRLGYTWLFKRQNISFDELT
jgi:hypothetical protein